MVGGYRGKLFVLAFDHRGSFQRTFFGIAGAPTAEQTERIADAKRLIFEGVVAALERGAPRDAAAILVDEQFGAGVAREARQRAIMLAMPVEKSGQDEFDLEYGDGFGAHIEAFDPRFTKVLVRYNPDGDPELNRRQAARLRRLGDWLAGQGRAFLFELLVPAEPAQLQAVGGDRGRFDVELRPELMRRTVVELQDAGIEPDIWKIEGVDDPGLCRRIADTARAGGRESVACVVLGRGADQAAVERWLEAGAGVPGYVGFAIGRTIWWEPLRGAIEGSLSREQAVEQVAANYLRMVEVYEGASAAV